MTSEESETTPLFNKGKGRAQDPTERTPLLDRPSGSSSSLLEQPAEPVTSQRRRLLTQLLYVFLLSLSLCIVVVLVLLLAAWSYTSRTSEMSPDDIIHKAVVFEGPQRIDVLNVSWSEGVWVNIQGRIGVDAGTVVGVNSDDEDSIFERIWKSVGRWGVRRLDRVSVSSSTFTVTPIQDNPPALAFIDVPPLEIPLTTDPPSDSSWLRPFSTPVFVRPTTNVTDLIHFAREAWKQGSVSFQTHVTEVDVTGGGLGSHGWRSILHRQLSNIDLALHIKIPPLPGLPAPGKSTPFPPVGDMVTLDGFNLVSIQNKLTIQAQATLIDPAPPYVNLTTPSLPFIVSLPTEKSSVPVAAVITKPFSLTHPNITLDITGHLLDIPVAASSSLSHFLSRYLSAKPNPIVISTPLLQEVRVDATFPAPNPRPQILRNVMIHDMKLKPGNTFLASGTVMARVVLPKGMNIDLDVKHILPDVLVFDGEVPEIVYPNTNSSAPPLPDPLPEGAFGHIRPDGWLDSVCTAVDPNENEGSSFNVTAKIVDVPLQVLPGRQKEFGDFVSKVIFGTDGAIAGILGNAAVKVFVEGLPLNGPGAHDGMELGGLPFKGSVKIGKKNLFTDALSQAKDGFETWKHYIGGSWW